MSLLLWNRYLLLRVSWGQLKQLKQGHRGLLLQPLLLLLGERRLSQVSGLVGVSALAEGVEVPLPLRLKSARVRVAPLPYWEVRMR